MVYRGSRLQRGHGLGGMLKKAVRKVMPFLFLTGKNAFKAAAPIAKKVAISAGTEMANKLLERGRAKAKKLSQDDNILKAVMGSAVKKSLPSKIGLKRKASDGPPKSATKKPKKTSRKKSRKSSKSKKTSKKKALQAKKLQGYF